MLIAVTGATGFVGGHLVQALGSRGHTVLPFGRRPSRLPLYQQWDIAHGPLAERVAVDAVVHCASMVGDWGAPAEFFAANVQGTRHVLQSFTSAPRFVHVSTASVYGPGINIREEAPYPGSYPSDYGRTKMLAEGEIVAASRPVIILRPRAIYGPGDTTLLPRLLAARRFGCQVAVGNGRNVVSLTHVDNLAHAVIRSIEGSCERGIFNVADALTARFDDVLRVLLQRLGLPERIVYVPKGVAMPLARVLEALNRRVDSQGPPVLTPYAVQQLAEDCTLDISAAREKLDYQPTYTYLNGPLTGDEEAMGMLQSHQEQPCHSIPRPRRSSPA